MGNSSRCPPTSSVHTFWGCGLRAFQVLLHLLVFLARYPGHQATRHHSCRQSACLHSLHEPSVVVVTCSRDWTREVSSPSLCFLKSPQCAACSAPVGVCITVYLQLCLKFPSIDRNHQRSSRETLCPGSRPQGGSLKDFWLISRGVRAAPGSWPLVVASYSADQEAGQARVIGGPDWGPAAVHIDLGCKDFH